MICYWTRNGNTLRIRLRHAYLDWERLRMGNRHVFSDREGDRIRHRSGDTNLDTNRLWNWHIDWPKNTFNPSIIFF